MKQKNLPLVLLIALSALVVLVLLVDLLRPGDDPRDSAKESVTIGLDATAEVDTTRQSEKDTDESATAEYTTYRIPDFDEISRLPDVGSLHEYFFTDTNRKGSIPDDAYDYSSGWPTVDPSRMPQDDRSAFLGESFAIRLTTENLYVAEPIGGPYENSYYSLYEPTYAFWHYRNAHGDERLAIYIDSTNIPLYLVFATDLGSTEVLRQVAETGAAFPATLVDAANVDYAQSQYLFLSGALSGHELVQAPLPSTRLVPSCGYRDGDAMCLFLDEAGDKAMWFVERMQQQYGLRE